MDEKRKREAILLACAAAGVVIGTAIRRRRGGQEIEVHHIVRQGIGTAGAAVAIATQVGNALGLEAGDERQRAAVTFITAAGLSLLAEQLDAFIPGVDLK